MAQRPGSTRSSSRTRTTALRTTPTERRTATQRDGLQSTRNGAGSTARGARPALSQRGPELQAFGTIAPLPNALDPDALVRVVTDLNQLLADTMTLRDLYKKHHWQVAGPTFYQLHLLFDKHYEEQVVLVDEIAERIQLLGGLSIAMAPDVAETTRIERPPRGREEVPVQISRLLEAHELILKFAHEVARRAEEAGDDGTNDLVVSDVIRTNELQVWFVSEHVVDMPLTHAR
jgi:starvation-inducible DNA-binding protein